MPEHRDTQAPQPQKAKPAPRCSQCQSAANVHAVRTGPLNEGVSIGVATNAEGSGAHGTINRSFLTDWVVVVAQTVDPQPRSTLDDPVRSEFRIADPRLLQPCETGTAVDQIVRNANALIGFENRADCGLSSRSRDAGNDGEILNGSFGTPGV
jgi:hypothetical protein